MTGSRRDGVGLLFSVFVACSTALVVFAGLVMWSWSEGFDLADLYPEPGSSHEVAIDSALEVWSTITSFAFWAALVSALGAGVSGVLWALRISR